MSLTPGSNDRSHSMRGAVSAERHFLHPGARKHGKVNAALSGEGGETKRDQVLNTYA
jgi:hypothetical protein